MIDFVLPSAILISLAAGVALTSLMKKTETKVLLDLLKVERERTADLLNRVQSQDLSTYANLTAIQNPQPSGYQSMSDEAEAKRYAQMMGESVGYGEVSYDEYDAGTLSDLVRPE